MMVRQALQEQPAHLDVQDLRVNRDLPEHQVNLVEGACLEIQEKMALVA